MNITVAKHVSGQRPKGLGFPRQRAIRVTQNHDRFEDIAFEPDGIVLRLHVKDSDRYSDLVAVTQRREHGQVQFAFRVFRDLTDKPPKNLTPKEIVIAFVNRFGVPIQLGEVQSKCFIGETITSFTNPTSGGLPPSHGFYIQPHFCKLNRTGGLDIFAAFCLDLKAYSEWLGAH